MPSSLRRRPAAEEIQQLSVAWTGSLTFKAGVYKFLPGFIRLTDSTSAAGLHDVPGHCPGPWAGMTKAGGADQTPVMTRLGHDNVEGHDDG